MIGDGKAFGEMLETTEKRFKEGVTVNGVPRKMKEDETIGIHINKLNGEVRVSFTATSQEQGTGKINLRVLQSLLFVDFVKMLTNPDNGNKK